MVPRLAEPLVDSGRPTLDWSAALVGLGEARFLWLATLGRGGRPHVRPVLAVWVDDALHTTSGPAAVKAANLRRDPRCSLTASADGLDLVVEGEARRVTEPGRLGRVRDAYAEKYGWPVTVDGDAFGAPYGAPTAGPPPYEPWAIEPTVVYGFGTDDATAPRSTRWRF